jgi:hypothetical protein
VPTVAGACLSTPTAFQLAGELLVEAHEGLETPLIIPLIILGVLVIPVINLLS